MQTPDASTVAFISLLLGGSGFIYTVFFQPSRADKTEMEKLLHKLEIDDANRYAAVQTELTAVGRMREEMAEVKAEIRHTREGIGDLKSQLNKLFDLIRDRK